ncbi:MAG: hypothetical protein R3E97_10435 [Candidatus Eisenbacteria bacterium]
MVEAERPVEPGDVASPPRLCEVFGAWPGDAGGVEIDGGVADVAGGVGVAARAFVAGVVGAEVAGSFVTGGVAGEAVADAFVDGGVVACLVGAVAPDKSPG